MKLDNLTRQAIRHTVHCLIGCGIGEVQIITGSTSADAFGENIGGGVTYRIGDSALKFYTEPVSEIRAAG